MSLRDILYGPTGFEKYSLEYFIALTTLSLAGFIIIRVGLKAEEAKKLQIIKGMSFTLSSVIIAWCIIEVILGRFFLETDLPLIFCNFVALLLPIYYYRRNQVLFELLYFLILAGATQAIITPGLKFHFPHYEFMKFWMVHVGLIVFILYEMIVFGKIPTSKGIFRTFVYVQLYVVLIMIANWILDSNYLFLNMKPDHGSVLDLLGGWPYYIIWMDLLLIPYFFIIYLPIWALKKVANK